VCCDAHVGIRILEQPHTLFLSYGLVGFATFVALSNSLHCKWIEDMKEFLLRLLIDEDGPTAVEYAVMLALIIVAALASIRLLGTGLNDSLTDSNTQMTSAFSG